MRDPQSGHGFRACSFKNMGKSWIFTFWGQNNNNKLEKNDEIGQQLVSGALDDTKQMRKTGADIFAKSGAENLENIGKSLNVLRNVPHCSPIVPWI